MSIPTTSYILVSNGLCTSGKILSRHQVNVDAKTEEINFDCLGTSNRMTVVYVCYICSGDFSK
ncbi:MAG: hypothetical protein NVV82_15515 [Sporocytophaga sp.]|nr:hypothetical protein [Sporocytophaga sp.]